MIDQEVIVGNVCSLCAMVTDSVSSTRKKNSEILGIQILSQFFYGAGTIILKAYSSTAQNAVAVLRNLAAMKQIKSRAVEWILILLGVALGILFNNRGLLGWMPIVANLEYSVAVFQFKNNERGLKTAFFANSLMYSVFSLLIRNYVGAAANFFVAVTTAVSLIREGKGGRREPGEDGPAPSEAQESEQPRNGGQDRH